MHATIPFDALLDEITTSYNHPKFNRNKYENWLSEQFGECIEVYVIRCCNNNETKKVRLVESFIEAHPTSKMYLSAAFKRVVIDLDISVSTQILTAIKVANESFISFQKPLKQAKDTVLVLSKKCWTELPFEQLAFVYFANQFLDLEKECYRMLKEVVKSCNQKQLIKAIQKIQRTLLSWSNEVIQRFHFNRLTSSRSKKLSYDKKSLFALGYDCLENILVHLERFYSKYLDRELFVPFNVISSRVNCLQPRVERLKLIILNKCYNQELLNMLFQPLMLVSNVSAKNRLTYHQLMFIECYTNKLLQFFSKHPQNSSGTTLLHKCLIELNYNNPDYVEHLAKIYSQKLNNIDVEQDKLATLHLWLKGVNQVVSLNEVQYALHIESLKSLVIIWLEEEIWYHKSILLVQSNSQNNSESVLSNSIEKLKLNCSVNELAVLIRMFSETEILHCKTHRELIELITNHFQTSKVQDISVKSLSNKFYEPDNNSIALVREKLIQMLNRLNQL
ncbi:hypothetical protein [Fluviicola taffensis]|uniref:Uncharacterized protein n=1 Tax=Fluviicola taffensis (strain DSM 16823 / NCIMB 13979 / RW262) TaxID=755732 RepID=F2IGH8_FLUTR|nr:hypothetical protein [Fluviicola taffensis]AEA42584.1 hypothetical protein Fluta_0579 [Fluviicola taffensis DSM 16823]